MLTADAVTIFRHSLNFARCIITCSLRLKIQGNSILTVSMISSLLIYTKFKAETTIQMQNPTAQTQPLHNYPPCAVQIIQVWGEIFSSSPPPNPNQRTNLSLT